MHKPSTLAGGVQGTIGTAPQTIATTKYSVGTAFENKYGDRYCRVRVKSDKAYDVYIFGSNTASFASTADSGTASGALLGSYTGQALNGTATTGIDGKVFYFPIAGYRWILPVVYQAAGSNAAVSILYGTFND